MVDGAGRKGAAYTPTTNFRVRRSGTVMRTIGRAALAAGCASVLAAVLAASAHAEGLGDAVALAYETNPTLQGERSQLRAIDEEYPQAEAGLRPTLNVTASYNYESEQVSEPGSPSVN